MAQPKATPEASKPKSKRPLIIACLVLLLVLCCVVVLGAGYWWFFVRTNVGTLPDRLLLSFNAGDESVVASDEVSSSGGEVQAQDGSVRVQVGEGSIDQTDTNQG